MRSESSTHSNAAGVVWRRTARRHKAQSGSARTTPTQPSGRTPRQALACSRHDHASSVHSSLVEKQISQHVKREMSRPHRQFLLTSIKRAPKHRSDTFELGHPQLRLISSYDHSSHISATSATRSGSFPPSCNGASKDERAQGYVWAQHNRSEIVLKRSTERQCLRFCRDAYSRAFQQRVSSSRALAELERSKAASRKSQGCKLQKQMMVLHTQTRILRLRLAIGH